MTAELIAYIIGKDEEKVKALIENTPFNDAIERASHYIWRVVQRDGSAFVTTNDFKPWRINLYIEHGIVIGAKVG
jgi:hypothetical protein